jgi:hypothetical protein
MEEEYSPAELIEERQRRVDEMNGVRVLPEGTTATELEFFEAVYLNENLPLGYRLKAAAERAKYTHAQLRAVAISQMDQHSFAQALERAIMRSQQPPPPPVLMPPEQHPASELKGKLSDAKAQLALVSTDFGGNLIRDVKRSAGLMDRLH